MTQKSLALVGSADGWRAGRGGVRRTLLICPPFQHTRVAPLSTVLLATFLRTHGLECREAHLHFELARLLGTERYLAVASDEGSTAGELLFAEGLHGELLAESAREELSAHFGPLAERTRMLSRFAASCLEQLSAARPDVIGLTTSLNQLMAALWLAKLVKQHVPQARVVLGGASCTDPMGRQILAAYPYVDLVVSGAGELPLLKLARGEEPAERFIESYQPVDLDALPTPDFSVLLEQAGEFSADPRFMLTFESSRGCWWGEKMHCRFCGLNGKQMRFSEKSSARVLAEVRGLWDAHRHPLMATDTILSRTHLKEVISKLAEFPERPRLFYEVKANMTQAEVVSLKRANATTLQPGIESLSTHLLQLMQKGTTAIQNLALLKWSREQGISLAWNQLCGIPGESVDDYDAQIALIEQIPHFNPPDGPNPVRLDRYSPYFAKYQEFGWSAVQPLRQYPLLHPQLAADDVARISFRFTGVGAVEPEQYLERFTAAVSRWRSRHDAGDGLFLHPQQGLIRNSAGKGFRFLPGPTLDAIVANTHDIVHVPWLLERVGCERSLLEELARQGIVYIEGNKVLNLAVRSEPPSDAGELAGAS
ncbi:MAG TPA: RiPP maturation radical SAM C-methyltransferase [Polyangiaceae bacterium]